MALGTLTIHHDYESGTTVEGTTRNSPAHVALRAHPSWTWSRYATAWLLRSSRHRQSKPYAVAEIESVLTEAGYTVERDIDDTMPSVEQQETDLADRMDDRADRLTERSGKHQATADATRAKADYVFHNIPMGQPLLVDHYSYKADRNRRERAWNQLGKSIKQGEYADELARRAETASHHMGARHNPVTVANRIEKQEADRRRLQRELDGEPGWVTEADEHGQPRHLWGIRHPGEERAVYLRREITTLTEQVDYWKGVYAQLQAEGKASTLGPDTVSKGDWVLYNSMWMRVRRVNKKSVTVPNPVFPPPRPGEKEATWTVAWHKLRGHRTTEQMPPEVVEAYEAPGTDRIN
ncbi:DUF3560 domain-containing protein [Amycolatopsis rubida]|uniref:DUF3560 domain-containing protein n=1 Tax=Amycolatopsis rubida TaxID=112413 RepID=A0ABX0BYZ1_9PSEU|nr:MULTISPECIES: DUF3560 domain-containing protein [Amycolatopsis]MYW90477.1 DUF3560 domain-containing protein [Amycolatopsis rubida]MYW95155.1 DUF3560 domain-containing protein [Amycolatopsis rubida]NEC55456.1 DUF3560 domain-containing protein [Amycolatopsis rubida]NEC60143.1 DUF3560 domain-containing protein [Amycolatopsis rubida]OAP25029.1 hypothetical protein A4R44_04098 [Amycolatopsis sp. M39]